jgi:hypothetical protein
MESDNNHNQEVVETYELLKRRRGCTGMFWRSDPAGKTRVASNNNWPRDNALLQGTAVMHKNQKWLHVTHVRQYYETDFAEAPKDAFMPFEYNNHYYLKAYKEEEKEGSAQSERGKQGREDTTSAGRKVGVLSRTLWMDQAQKKLR